MAGNDDAEEKKNSTSTATSTSLPPSLKKKHSPSGGDKHQRREASPAPSSSAAAAAAADLRDCDGDLFATARDLDLLLLPNLAEEEEEGVGGGEDNDGSSSRDGEGTPKSAAAARGKKDAAVPHQHQQHRAARRPSLSDYAHVAIIGRGAFGEVRLVRELKKGGRLAALKSLDKAEMLRRRQVAHVRAERDALATLRALGGEGRRNRNRRRRKRQEGREGSGGDDDDGNSDDDGNTDSDENSDGDENSDDDEAADASRHVVALRASFQDERRLHLVMEYLPGGDLMTLLMRMDVLPVVGFFFFFEAFFKLFSCSFLSLSLSPPDHSLPNRTLFCFLSSVLQSEQTRVKRHKKRSKTPEKLIKKRPEKNPKKTPGKKKKRTGPASTPPRPSSPSRQCTL